MVFLFTVDPSPRPEPMKFPVFSSKRQPSAREYRKFPVFSQLAGNLGDSETGSLVTPSSSAESRENRSCEDGVTSCVRNYQPREIVNGLMPVFAWLRGWRRVLERRRPPGWGPANDTRFSAVSR